MITYSGDIQTLCYKLKVLAKLYGERTSIALINYRGFNRLVDGRKH